MIQKILMMVGIELILKMNECSFNVQLQISASTPTSTSNPISNKLQNDEDLLMVSLKSGLQPLSLYGAMLQILTEIFIQLPTRL
jgi:hypothetical protein